MSNNNFCIQKSEGQFLNHIADIVLDTCIEGKAPDPRFLYYHLKFDLNNVLKSKISNNENFMKLKENIINFLKSDNSEIKRLGIVMSKGIRFHSLENNDKILYNLIKEKLKDLWNKEEKANDPRVLTRLSWSLLDFDDIEEEYRWKVFNFITNNFYGFLEDCKSFVGAECMALASKNRIEDSEYPQTKDFMYILGSFVSIDSHPDQVKLLVLDYENKEYDFDEITKKAIDFGKMIISKQ